MDYRKVLGDALRKELPSKPFAAGGRVPPHIALPRLSVEGVGDVEFPLRPAQAQQLIAKACVPAPHGRGLQTVVDTKVRRTWQVDGDKIALSDGWEQHMQELVGWACAQLGLDAVAMGVQAQ